jgi:cytosine/adenosine deaminase-related metal-dependent hydrolase
MALGIDEAGLNDDRDMLQEMRLALRLNRDPGLDQRAPSSAQILEMATTGGAATTLFSESIGSIEPGRDADLVFFDWSQISYPYLSPSTSPVDAFVLRAKPAHVRRVLVAGNEIYRDGRFLGLNKSEILHDLAQSMSKPISATEADRASLASELMAYVESCYRSYLERSPADPFYSFNSKH